LALNGQSDVILGCPRNPSLLRPGELLQDQIYQQDDDDHTGSDILEELARPILITSEVDNEWHEPQEHPEVEVEVEQKGQDGNSGNNGEIDVSNGVVNDFENNSDQDINQVGEKCESPLPAKRRRAPLSYNDSTSKRSSKLRSQPLHYCQTFVYLFVLLLAKATVWSLGISRQQSPRSYTSSDSMLTQPYSQVIYVVAAAQDRGRGAYGLVGARQIRLCIP
jgi:hypothetical protein